MGLCSLAALWWWDHLGRLGPDPESLAARYQLGGDGATDIGLGLLLGWAAVIACDQALARHDWARFLDRKIRQATDGMTASQAVFLALTSGIGEELLFRGVVHPLLTAELGRVVGGLLGALVFALAHLGPDRRFLGWSLFAWVMGLVLAGLYEVTGGLLAPISLHCCVNGLNLLQIVWERRLEPPVRLALSRSLEVAPPAR